jgi:hypothetical protein
MIVDVKMVFKSIIARWRSISSVKTYDGSKEFSSNRRLWSIEVLYNSFPTVISVSWIAMYAPITVHIYNILSLSNCVSHLIIATYHSPLLHSLSAQIWLIRDIFFNYLLKKLYCLPAIILCWLHILISFHCNYWHLPSN